MRISLPATLLMSLILGACTPTLETVTPAASMDRSAVPTVTTAKSNPETYPTPTFSPTFTALPPGQGRLPDSLHMMDETTGWGIEEGSWDAKHRGHILHTQDGGATWQDVTPPQGAYQDRGFFALDGRSAWASPFGEICKQTDDGGFACRPPTQTYVWSTRDGGQTWSASQPICIAASCDPSGVSPADWLIPGGIYFLDG